MSQDNFRAQDPIVRGEAAKFYVWFAQVLQLEKTKTAAECQFNDLEWYDYTLVPKIVEACEYGLFKGHNWNFMPNKKITEAEALTVTIRSLMWVQDETKNPRWSEYHAIGEWLWILDGETVWDLDVPATRKTVGTWLYKASQVDTNAAQSEGTQELKGILEDIFGADFFTE